MSHSQGRLKVGVLHESEVIRQGLGAMVSAERSLELWAVDVNPRRATDTELDSLDVLLASQDFAFDVLGRPRACDGPAVIAVATCFGDQVARNLIRQGARGLLLLSVASDELQQAVLRVGAGGRHITPAVASVMAEHVGTPGLTCREVTLLELLARGMSNKAIARTLGISDGTVKTHARSIFSKLGANNRTQAVAVAGRRGILRLGAEAAEMHFDASPRAAADVFSWASRATRSNQAAAAPSVAA